MWTVVAGISALSGTLWATTAAHEWWTARPKRRSKATQQAIEKSPILFGEADAAALDALMLGGKNSLRIEQTDNGATLSLTVKRGKK